MAIRDARYERSELDPLRRRSEEGQRQPAFEDRVIPLPQLDEVVPDPDRIEPCLLGASSDCGEVLSHSGIPARPFEVVDLETEFHAPRLLAARLVIVRERAAVRLGRPNLPRCIVAHATTPRARGRMKAFALTVAEQPAALTDLPDPEIARDEALVSVRAASVNGFDVYQASGGLMAMMPHQLPTVIGRDLAGVVVAVGPDRTDVTVGEEVLGFVTSTPPLHRGTWAELVAGGPDLVLARMPADLSWEAAAAIPLAASTALDAVDAVDPKPGDTLLVMGATGGVG